jgi:hypothetical protein
VPILPLVQARQVAASRPEVGVAQRRLDLAHLGPASSRARANVWRSACTVLVPRCCSHCWAIARAVSGCPAVPPGARLTHTGRSCWRPDAAGTEQSRPLSTPAYDVLEWRDKRAGMPDPTARGHAQSTMTQLCRSLGHRHADDPLRGAAAHHACPVLSWSGGE